MSSDALLEEILASLERLPDLPVVALKVNSMLGKPDTDAQELAEVIMMDPALTAQILKICNSAEYGFSRKIGTISEAVSILGYNALKRVIFTIISHSLLNRPVEGYGLEKGALWENALTCGAYARYLASMLGYQDAELALVAALLRDIGKIALNGYLNGKRELLETTSNQEKCAFSEAERMIIGVNHTVVGASLATRWNLPDSLTKVIVYHHQPSEMADCENPDERQLVSLVHLADVFTMMTGIGVGIDGLMYPLDAKAFETLGIQQEPAALEILYAELLDLRQQIESMSKTLIQT